MVTIVIISKIHVQEEDSVLSLLDLKINFLKRRVSLKSYIFES